MIAPVKASGLSIASFPTRPATINPTAFKTSSKKEVNGLVIGATADLIPPRFIFSRRFSRLPLFSFSSSLVFICASRLTKFNLDLKIFLRVASFLPISFAFGLTPFGLALVPASSTDETEGSNAADGFAVDSLFTVST